MDELGSSALRTLLWLARLGTLTAAAGELGYTPGRSPWPRTSGATSPWYGTARTRDRPTVRAACQRPSVVLGADHHQTV